MPEATLSLSSARPNLLIDGQDAADLAASMFEMSVAERSDGMAHAEISFGAWGIRNGGPDYTLFTRDRLEFGKLLEVRLGDVSVFKGRIMALEGRFPEGGVGESELAVFAEDRLQDLRMTRRTRSFEQMSDADLAQRLASDHGLQAQVDLPGPTHAVLTQVNQSDLAFLRDRARALGGEIWVDGDTLHLAPRPSRHSGSAIDLSYGNTLQGFDVRADLAHQRTSLNVSGWSRANKEAINERADDSVLSSELNGGDGGLSLLQRTLGSRPDTVSHLMPDTADEARSMAQSWLRQIGRRFVCGRGVCQPQASMRAGRHVNLQGLGALFDGEYTVTEVCHRFDAARGLRTEFAVERPAIGRP